MDKKKEISPMEKIRKAYFDDLDKLIRKHTEAFITEFGVEGKGVELGKVIDFNQGMMRTALGIHLIVTYSTAVDMAEQSGVEKLKDVMMCRVVGNALNEFMSGIIPHICGEKTSHEIHKYMLGKKMRPGVDSLADMIMEGAKPVNMEELLNRVKAGGIKH